MTFFYNLNKTLDAIREKPETTHGQLNERDMSRAAKGYEKYGKEGMEALAKAGREGKSLDPVRNKYDKYDESVEEGMGDMARKVGGMAKKAGSAVLNKVGHGSDADMIRDLQRKMGVPQTGTKPGDKPNPKQVKEVTAPIDFDKVLDAIAALYGDDIWENDAMQDLANDLEQAGPTDRELDFIIAKGKLPKRLAGIQFSAGDSVRFGESSAPMSPKQKSFAALAEPTDKITFADKIAGAKKEVDEMLGDVAAEAMKKALGGGRGRSAEMGEEASQGNAFTAHKRPKVEKPAVGTVTHGRKHDVEEIPGGRRVTRRVDPSGISVGADDEAAQSGEKRGRGRPKKAGGPAQERVTANSRKADRTRFQSKKVKEAVGSDDIEVIERLMDTAFAEGNKALGNALQTALERIQGDQDEDQYGDEQVSEKAVSKKQQKFMGMVHATQKGEKAPSKEVAKTAKSMGKKDAEDFASTKHKGLPEKKKPEGKKDASKEAPKKKKEKTEEAGGTDTPTASSGFSYGKGIYDSMNRDLEDMIAESMSRLDESMNISMSMNNDSMHGGASKSLTVTATEEDAVKLGALLKMAGIGGTGGEAEMGASSCPSCGSAPCGCAEVVDENQPDWPTDTETSNDAFQYSGGLNKPKSTGQSTVPVLASQDDRQESYAAEEEDAIKRMMEMAGMSAPGGASAGDYIDYVSASGEQPPEDLIMQNGVEYDPDTNVISVRNATSLANTHRAIAAAGWKKQTAGARPNPAAAGQAMQAGDTAYQLGEQDAIDRMMEMAGVKKKEVDEEKTEEGNKFTGNLAKARADGKKEADLDGDGDMEKVRESIFNLTNQWKAYKG